MNKTFTPVYRNGRHFLLEAFSHSEAMILGKTTEEFEESIKDALMLITEEGP